MNSSVFEPEPEVQRAAINGVVGYRLNTDDRLHDLELREQRYKPKSQPQPDRRPGSGPMMPPPMQAGAGRPSAGAPTAGAKNLGTTPASPGATGLTPNAASNAGANVGMPANRMSSSAIAPNSVNPTSTAGAVLPNALAGGRITPPTITGQPSSVGPVTAAANPTVGSSGLAGANGIAGPRPSGTMAAGAPGSSYSPYGINPSTGQPWRETDPGYPPLTTRSAAGERGLGSDLQAVGGSSDHDLVADEMATPPLVQAGWPGAGTQLPSTGTQLPSNGAAAPVSGGPLASSAGGNSNSFTVNPAELGRTGGQWDALGERMRMIGERAAALSADEAKFGIVKHPSAAYLQAQQEALAAGRSLTELFKDNDAKLQSTSRSYEDADSASSSIARNWSEQPR